MHHGSKKSACKNTPPVKCATLKTSDNASIPAFLSGSGVSVIPPGGAGMALRPCTDLQMRASADRLVHAVGTTPGEETGHERDRQNHRQRSVRALRPDV